MATATVVCNKKKTFLSSLVHHHTGHGRTTAHSRTINQDSPISGINETPTIRIVPYDHRAAEATPTSTSLGIAVGGIDNRAEVNMTSDARKKPRITENYSYPLLAREDTRSVPSIDSGYQPTFEGRHETGIGMNMSPATPAESVATAVQDSCGSGSGHFHVPRSKTSALGPLEMNPPMLVPSATMPLDVLSGPPSTHDIGTKTERMLKATEELKPMAKAKRLPSSSTTSKLAWTVRNNSLIRRVLSNNLAERLHIKNHAKVVKGQGVADDEMLKPLCLREKLSPITAVEIRLNEGENLSKRKVQQMVGTQIMRKPVRRGNKSPQSSITSLDDPFSEKPDARRAPTEFENCLRTDSRIYSIAPPFVLKNPFESEMVLESDVDSPLRSSPVASSTPRHLPGRDCLFAARGSPVRRIGFPRAYKPDTDGKLFEAPNDQGDIPRFYTPVVVCPDTGAKKHPSPAKSDLEVLEREFKKRYLNDGTVHHEDNDHYNADSAVDDDGDTEATEAVNRAYKTMHRSVVLIPDGCGSSLFYAPPSALIRSQTEVRVSSFIQSPHTDRVASLNLEVPFHSSSNEVY